jgi:hypothetical protein
MRRGRAAAVVAVLLTACQSHSPAKPAASIEIREPLAIGERAQPAHDERTGHLRVRLLGALADVPGVTGSHAEFIPERPLVRVRVRVASGDARFHLFEPGRARAVLPDRSVIEQSIDARHVKRQAESYGLGARDVVELDLWFEPPDGVRPTAIRLYGDNDPDPQGVSVAVAGPAYVDLPVRF